MGDVEQASVCADLIASGLAVRDGFTSPSAIAGLLDCARTRSARGEFKAARVGAAGAPPHEEEIRGDYSCWLQEPLLEAERSLLESFERLRLELNRNAYLGLLELELHYATYRAGAGYVRHIDQLRGQRRRAVTLILYLNECWQNGDGGELRVFDSGETYRDIEPVGGRLVCFLTAGQEHAVRPTQVERWSVSGWFLGRE